MAATQTSDLDGLFKEVYADKMENLIPENSHLQKDVKFIEKTKQTGKTYNQPVILTQEQGVTLAAADAGAFDLNESVPMTTKNATVLGYQVLLRGQLDYESAARSMGNTRAFMEATALQVENMYESMSKRIDILGIYGQSGLVVSSGTTSIGAGSTTFEATAASWAIGIWSGSEKMKVDAFDGTTKLNTVGDLVVSNIDFENRQFTLTGDSSDITAIDDTGGVGVGAGVTLYYKGGYDGSAFSEMPGLNTIITNTTTLFGINAGTYRLWKGNSYSAGSADLTIDKVLRGLNLPVGLGLMENACLYVSVPTWQNLSTEITGNRVYDTSYKTQENSNGTQSIKYYSQNGMIEVKSNPCVKEGEAFLFPKSRAKRIGSTDITFKTPGRGDEIFRQLENKAGFEYRCYTDQSMFIETPARCLKFTNIVNS